MELPPTENSDNLWSQIYTRSSPLPGDQNGDRVLYENGFAIASENEGQNSCSALTCIWNSAVCCVRTVVENTADCQQALCSCLSIQRRVYGTQSVQSIQKCTPHLERQQSQQDRFAGASAPPRPDMERSLNSNSDSPPYMPSGSQRIHVAEIVAEPQSGISDQNGHSSHHGASESKKRNKYLRQSQPNFRDLPV